MESWNHIVNTVVLGSEKRSLKAEELEPLLSDQFAVITESNFSKEEQLLQTAALHFNFRQCGYSPAFKGSITIRIAEAESKEYASEKAHQALRDIIEMDSNALFYFWLKRCGNAQKIVQPEMLPILFSTAVREKQLHSLAAECAGKRGEWLIQFNPAWKFAQKVDDAELWHTGTLEERIKILEHLRLTSPSTARELIQGVWPQENAATKRELIETLNINTTEEDITWLEELLNEKSSKVKEVAIEILKKIPSSSIVQLYWKLLEPSIELRKEKGLLGLGSKLVIDFSAVKQIDDTIYKTGIEKVSSEKNVSDHNFLLYQLIMSVPPSFLEHHLKLSKSEILKAMQLSNPGKDFIPALGKAAIRFNELEWLRTIIELRGSNLFLEALTILPQREAEAYAIQHLDADANAAEIIGKLVELKEEWSSQLARSVLKFTSRNPYQYNKNFYDQNVHLLPGSIVSELERFSPKEEHARPYWNKLSEHITKLLTLKQQTREAFDE